MAFETLKNPIVKIKRAKALPHPQTNSKNVTPYALPNYSRMAKPIPENRQKQPSPRRIDDMHIVRFLS